MKAGVAGNEFVVTGVTVSSSPWYVPWAVPMCARVGTRSGNEMVNGRRLIANPIPRTMALRHGTFRFGQQIERRGAHSATAFAFEKPVSAKMRMKKAADRGTKCIRKPQRSMNSLV